MLDFNVYLKNRMDLNEKAKLENAFASAEENAMSINDLVNAVAELGDLFSEQDDALVELAGIIEEGE